MSEENQLSNDSLPASDVSELIGYSMLLNNAHNILAHTPTALAAQMACVALDCTNNYMLGLGLGLKDIPDLQPDDSIRGKKDPTEYLIWFYCKYRPQIDRLLGVRRRMIDEARNAEYQLPRMRLKP